MQTSTMTANSGMQFHKQNFGRPQQRKSRQKSSFSAGDISLSSFLSGSGGHRDSQSVQPPRSPNKRRSVFRSRWTSSKPPSLDTPSLGAAQATTSASSLSASRHRDRSNSDPAVAALTPTAAALTLASVKLRKLTPPSGPVSTFTSKTLVPPLVDVDRCHSVPADIALADEGNPEDEVNAARRAKVMHSQQKPRMPARSTDV